MAIKINKDLKKKKVESPSYDWNNLLQKEISLFGKSLSFAQKENFYRQMAVLMSSGLDIQKALNILEENEPKKKLKTIWKQIREALIEGLPFHKAIQQTEYFSDYEVFSMQIGEETGDLVKVLKNLEAYYTQAVKYKRQLIQALSYPVFVISFAILVLIFMLQYMVPMFSDMYGRYDGDLPWITQQTIALSDFMSNYSIYILLIIVLIIGLLYYFRKNEWMRRILSAIILKIPIFGGIIKNIYLSRLCNSMYMLLSSKVPLLFTTNLVKQMISFYPIEQALGTAEKEITNGAALHESLSKFRFFPSSFIALIKVGEESAQLDNMFQTLAQQYTNATEQSTAIISSLLEPILIIFLGFIVGFILIAMYLPMFEMSTYVG